MAKTFLWFVLGGSGTALSIFLRNYILYSQYDDPPALRLIPLLFEYVAFSIVVVIFPWIWKKGKNKTQRLVYVILGGSVFSLLHIFLLSCLKWFSGGMDYNLGMAVLFGFTHSFLITLTIYILICLVVYALGLTQGQTSLKKSYLKRIPHKLRNETSFILVGEIEYLESDGNYISIYTDNSNRFLIRKVMGSLEKELDPRIFQRVHRKYIVNLEKITSYKSNPNGGYLVSLKSGKSIKLSKNYRKKIKLLKQNDDT